MLGGCCGYCWWLCWRAAARANWKLHGLSQSCSLSGSVRERSVGTRKPQNVLRRFVVFLGLVSTGAPVEDKRFNPIAFRSGRAEAKAGVRPGTRRKGVYPEPRRPWTACEIGCPPLPSCGGGADTPMAKAGAAIEVYSLSTRGREVDTHMAKAGATNLRRALTLSIPLSFFLSFSLSPDLRSEGGHANGEGRRHESLI